MQYTTTAGAPVPGIVGTRRGTRPEKDPRDIGNPRSFFATVAKNDSNFQHFPAFSAHPTGRLEICVLTCAPSAPGPCVLKSLLLAASV